MTNIKKIIATSGVALLTSVFWFIPNLSFAATLSRQLELGMSGPDVSSLQTFLATDATVYPQGLITGYFGTLTQAAVAKWQTKNGIPSVGRVGPATLAAINMSMGNTTSGNTQVPAIGFVTLSTTSNSVTINWNTSQNTSATVYYNTSPLAMTEASASNGITIFGNNYPVNSDLRTTHSAVITGLNPNTTYYYVVYTKDAAGNENVTWPTTFTTPSI